MQRKAKIYQPSKTAMQSGTAATQQWVLEFTTDDRKFVDPLMGWIGSADTVRQLKLRFATAEEAVAYATEHQLPYDVTQPKTRSVKPKSYASNFAAGRRKFADLPPAPSKNGE